MMERRVSRGKPQPRTPATSSRRHRRHRLQRSSRHRPHFRRHPLHDCHQARRRCRLHHRHRRCCGWTVRAGVCKLRSCTRLVHARRPSHAAPLRTQRRPLPSPLGRAWAPARRRGFCRCLVAPGHGRRGAFCEAPRRLAPRASRLPCHHRVSSWWSASHLSSFSSSPSLPSLSSLLSVSSLSSESSPSSPRHARCPRRPRCPHRPLCLLRPRRPPPRPLGRRVVNQSRSPAMLRRFALKFPRSGSSSA